MACVGGGGICHKTMPTSSLLLLGGTFDPIHNGHLIVSRAVAEAVGCTGVLLIPAAQSPHKQGVTSPTPASHRLELLKIAIEGNTFFGISELELKRPSPSYTYDTVESLLQQGWRNLTWMIGADQLLALPKWHRAAELVQKVRFVIAARPGWQCDFLSLPTPFCDLADSVVNVPVVEISSTQIRQRVSEGKSIRYLVPDGVEDYILANKLYPGK